MVRWDKPRILAGHNVGNSPAPLTHKRASLISALRPERDQYMVAGDLGFNR